MSQILNPNSGGGGGGTEINQINGDSGYITGNIVTIYANNAANQAGSTVLFTDNAGHTISTLQLTDVNANTMLGGGSGNLTMTGTANSALGAGAFPVITSGYNNCGFNGSGLSLTSGHDNCFLGQGSGNGITSGNNNIFIGNGSGGELQNSSSDNIYIGNEGIISVASGFIKIGTSGTHLSCQIAGIQGISVASPNIVTIDSLGSNKLGSVSLLPTALGGTNANSFTQSNGIVTYNGTRLVNYAGPQISPSGILTNTTQPVFLVYLNSSVNNVTGDGTTYSVLFDTTAYDIGGNITLNSAGKTIFTAPVTGTYQFNLSLSATVVLIGISGEVQVTLIGTSSSYQNSAFPYNYIGGNFGISTTMKLTAGDTVYANYLANAVSKNIGLVGGAAPFVTWWSGYLVG